jgi:hypothetical protein
MAERPDFNEYWTTKAEDVEMVHIQEPIASPSEPMSLIATIADTAELCVEAAYEMFTKEAWEKMERKAGYTVHSKPKDESLKAFKEWIGGMYQFMTGLAVNEIEPVSDEKWTAEWQAYWKNRRNGNQGGSHEHGNA